MIGIISFIVLIAVGVVFGGLNERRHFERLRRDEADLAYIQRSTLKTIPEVYRRDLDEGAILVSGNVVIALDYFKNVAATLKSLIGGSLSSYETMLDRARREAIVRMLKEAESMGATAVYNIRVEFSVIGGEKAGTPGGAELLAYGTAVKAKEA
jgi:uncharacterized protein YbjQ (UPF0145 family)